MKGLLLKDIYMTRKYCKLLLLVMMGFGVLAIADSMNLFFLFYPTIIASMLSATILGYDEKSHWDVYGQIFPYSRKQLVSVKYLMSLLFVCGMWLFTAAIQLINILAHGISTPKDSLFLLLFALSGGLFSSGVLLPVMFKFGTEKGRLAYMLVIVLVCCGSSAATACIEWGLKIPLSAGMLAFIILVGSSVFFLLSWFVSVKLYEKREL